MLKVIKDKIFIESQAKASRWRQYFKELLNTEMPKLRHRNGKQRAEPELKKIIFN